MALKNILIERVRVRGKTILIKRGYSTPGQRQESNEQGGGTLREKDETMALQGGNNIIGAMRRVLDVLKLRLTYEM